MAGGFALLVGKVVYGLQIGSDIEIVGSEVDIAAVEGIVGELKIIQDIIKFGLERRDAEIGDSEIVAGDLCLKIGDLSLSCGQNSLKLRELTGFDGNISLYPSEEIAEVLGFAYAGESAGYHVLDYLLDGNDITRVY